jgi:putative transposase
LVAQAADYPWSSHGHYIGRRADKLVMPHPLVWELGNTPFAREAAYAELVQAGVNPVHQTALTQATLSGWALGEPDFVADLQKRTQRRVAKGQAGRPHAANNL